VVDIELLEVDTEELELDDDDEEDEELVEVV